GETGAGQPGGGDAGQVTDLPGAQSSSPNPDTGSGDGGEQGTPPEDNLLPSEPSDGTDLQKNDQLPEEEGSVEGQNAAQGLMDMSGLDAVVAGSIGWKIGSDRERSAKEQVVMHGVDMLKKNLSQRTYRWKDMVLRSCSRNIL
ncbi:MAG: hypothetical protein WCR47_04340, partial [Desulfoplanes sp.]